VDAAGRADGLPLADAVDRIVADADPGGTDDTILIALRW
jgi:hypothetical protein